MADYRANLEEVKRYDMAVYEQMMLRNPTHCSRAFFRTTSCCEDALNNFSESYNSTIERARAMPLVEMLETIRRQAMIRIEFRKNRTMAYQGKFTPKVGNVIEVEERERSWIRTYPGPTGLFEAHERGISYTVNMKEKTCTCRRWDLTGIPCRHALRVVVDNDQQYRIDELVSDWYLTSFWRNQYNDSIRPLHGLKFWKDSGETHLEAPAVVRSKGNPKSRPKRIKGVNESPKKGKKVTKHNSIIHCSRCGLCGHNSAGCKNFGVSIRPRKRARRTGVAETYNLHDGEGPSQPSQPTQ